MENEIYRDRLLKLRSSLDLTQREFAKKIMVTSGAIALWESGQRKIPGPVKKLIEIFENEKIHKSMRRDKYETT